MLIRSGKSFSALPITNCVNLASYLNFRRLDFSICKKNYVGE